MGVKKYTIETVKQFIDEHHKNSQLLSTEYYNAKTMLDISCRKGHIFSTNLNMLKNRGSWCPHCAKNVPHTIEDVKKYIDKHHAGSRLVSKEYKNNKTKLEIICENGHDCFMDFGSIKNNHWCAVCAGNKKLDFDFVKSRIYKKHPNCTILSSSDKYKNTKIKLDIICENNHEFKISMDGINDDNWCPYCAQKAKMSIEIVRDYMKLHYPHITVVSDKYINNHTKLHFICDNGHDLYMSFHYIRNNKPNICIYCNGRKEHLSCRAEKLCREVFEEIFGVEFKKTYPTWLKNPKTNFQLELDGFNSQLKLAFEYQGQQHYEYPNHFHKTKEQFEEQQYRDQIKRNLCKQNNITLIEIPYFNNYLKTNAHNKIASILSDNK